MIKYDNCKNCVRLCEHAGKDREFVCPGGISCKSTAAPVGAFGTDGMIERALELLDIQRGHCIDKGADKTQHFFFSGSAGNPEQNTYYSGHLNLMEAMLIPIRKGIAIDKNQHHYIYDLED